MRGRTVGVRRAIRRAQFADEHDRRATRSRITALADYRVGVQISLEFGVGAGARFAARFDRGDVARRRRLAEIHVNDHDARFPAHGEVDQTAELVARRQGRRVPVQVGRLVDVEPEDVAGDVGRGELRDLPGEQRVARLADRRIRFERAGQYRNNRPDGHVQSEGALPL